VHLYSAKSRNAANVRRKDEMTNQKKGWIMLENGLWS